MIEFDPNFVKILKIESICSVTCIEVDFYIWNLIDVFIRCV